MLSREIRLATVRADGPFDAAESVKVAHGKLVTIYGA
jgi:hypothetical protein